MARPPRVLMVWNEGSGYGRAAALARACAAALHPHHPVTLAPAGPGLPDPLAQATADDLAVLVGGDGTVHHALPALIRSGAAAYQVPTGTENLFARDWGMTRNPARLRRAVARWRIARADLGAIDARPVAIMASTGFDASIIARRAAATRRGEGHLAYVRPILGELAHPAMPRLSLTIDGRTLAHRQRGVAIVSVSRQYAARLDPLDHARTDDGLLDAAFLPCASRAEALVLALHAWARRLDDLEGVQRGRGRVVDVLSHDGPAPVQADGESLEPRSAWRAETLPAALRVLDARGL